MKSASTEVFRKIEMLRHSNLFEIYSATFELFAELDVLQLVLFYNYMY